MEQVLWVFYMEFMYILNKNKNYGSIIGIKIDQKLDQSKPSLPELPVLENLNPDEQNPKFEH